MSRVSDILTPYQCFSSSWIHSFVFQCLCLCLLFHYNISAWSDFHEDDLCSLPDTFYPLTSLYLLLSQCLLFSAIFNFSSPAPKTLKPFVPISYVSNAIVFSYCNRKLKSRCPIVSSQGKPQFLVLAPAKVVPSSSSSPAPPSVPQSVSSPSLPTSPHPQCQPALSNFQAPQPLTLLLSCMDQRPLVGQL